MKTETKTLPQIKLRDLSRETLAEISREAIQDVQKKSVFIIFFIYRALLAFITASITCLYLAVGFYIKKGEIQFSAVYLGIFLICIMQFIVIMIYFFKKTDNLQHLFSMINSKTDIKTDLVAVAYGEAFFLPDKITRTEILFSFIMLIPYVLLEISGLYASIFSGGEIVLAWWLGNLTLLLSIFLFTQLWTEKTLTRLYDHGIRVPPEKSLEANNNIYLRIILIMVASTGTLILMYSSLFIKSIIEVAGESAYPYLWQLLVVSGIVFLGTAFFMYFIVKSIKRAVDNLQDKMDKVRSGDYSVEIVNFRDDEIGKLYTHFGYMLGSLNHVVGTMDDEVQKRTARLEDINTKLSKYLSPQLYSKIYDETDDTSLGYQRKKLTVFFSDMMNFTALSESLDPDELSRILNQYLDSMAQVALKWGGTIDKYIGDAVMIFFGDPEFLSDRDHALRCVRMSIEMIDKLNDLRHDWKQNGIAYQLNIRIGINTGFCTVGNFGSESRMDYTILGSAVNLASRLESAAPENGILVSESTLMYIKDEFICEPVPELLLKGIDKPVQAYLVKNERKASVDTEEMHTEGFDLRLNADRVSPESKTSIKKALEKAIEMLDSDE